MSNYSKYVGKVFTLKKDFGPLRSGTHIYCFAQEGDLLWFELPQKWSGVNQINLKEHVLLGIV